MTANQTHREPRRSILDGYLPSLDGWRAISIILVIFSHSKKSHGFPNLLQGFSSYFSGELGVHVFFVISGFLITFLLLREHGATGTISIRSFYERRALRILPVYFAFLAAMATIQAFTPLHGSLPQWLGALTFTANYFPAPPAMSHLWSLSVEEQFYILWPGIVFMHLASPRTERKALGVRKLKILVWIALASAPALRVVAKFHQTPLLGYLSFFTNFDLLGWGCLLAVYMKDHTDLMRSVCLRNGFRLSILGLILVVVPIILVKNDLLGIITLPFRFTLTGMGVAILITVSIFHHNRGVWRLLNLSAVRWIGVLSYSIYIWHRPFTANPETFGIHSAWWIEFPGLVLASLLIAAISFYALERPLMSLRKRLHREKISG